MTAWIICFGATAVILLLVHIFSVVTATRRCRRTSHLPAPANAPKVTVIRPVCGFENNLEQTLRSSFALDYPALEIVVCVVSPDDAAIVLIDRLMAEHPGTVARLLVGNDPISENPKLNNVVKGWRAATADWIVMADSNVLMPPDYIQRLLAAWRPDTGVVCSPATGGAPVGFFAELECAFLNTYEVRWQYTAAETGFGFAQGKNMLFRRDVLERCGGMRALAAEPAEDAAATKVVRAAGLRVRLVDAPFIQPLGTRRAADVWARQVRWARLRRASFKTCYALEIVTSGLWPVAAAFGCWASSEDVSFAVVPACAAVWYGGEAMLARAAGWPLTWRSPFAWLLRDALLPVLWISGWLDSRFVWRGNQMRAFAGESPA
jgi:ceramide glucosyltransferase